MHIYHSIYVTYNSLEWKYQWLGLGLGLGLAFELSWLTVLRTFKLHRLFSAIIWVGLEESKIFSKIFYVFQFKVFPIFSMCRKTRRVFCLAYRLKVFLSPQTVPFNFRNFCLCNLHRVTGKDFVWSFDYN